ncbi:spermatogenesis-associated serine-rich protein 1 [Dipodomys spectabilis]|uniref:spermatogenesis-associated serine-rich protein 1 n=1 Tax=Dipodomys spectabilis TaxID=105255 RepID=UPI001C5488A6|nr:spermatogenesis-associated serine-rich protein 1 [Dipodomys spectabilis]
MRSGPRGRLQGAQLSREGEPGTTAGPLLPRSRSRGRALPTPPARERDPQRPRGRGGRGEGRRQREGGAAPQWARTCVLATPERNPAAVAVAGGREVPWLSGLGGSWCLGLGGRILLGAGSWVTQYREGRNRLRQDQDGEWTQLSSKKSGGLDAEYNYAVQSEGCVASTAPCNEKTSSPSAVETGSCAREPLSLDSMGPYCKTAADLGGKCCSPSSNHSSENSLSEGPKLREELSLLKCLTEDGQRPEWTFYPRPSSNIHTYHVGKQCLFNGVFLGNKRSLAERTVDKMLGRKKYDIDSRNGIPALNPGDNPYMIPEQSKGFYKAGATLPPVNFALVPYEKKFDTFIPLEPLPQIPTLPFSEKEKANNLKNEIKEVEELEYWQPAPTLVQSIFLSGALDFPRKP